MLDLPRIEQRIDRLREDLRARYGWTHLDVRVAVEREAIARIKIAGTIAVPSVRTLLREALHDLIAPGLALELELRAIPVHRWVALPSAGLELWAQHPSQATQALATELSHADGPVGELARDRGASLLRARDGTVGWTDTVLEIDQPPRLLCEPVVPEDPGPAIREAALAYLGAPYWLGANGSTRIDCSALVQRSYSAALQLLVPRNSNDQLAIARGGESIERASGQAGDLIFIRSHRMQRTHVGIATGRATIIHASRSRGAVIEEYGREFEADAEWIRRVTWPQVVEWARAQVGRPHVDLMIADDR